MQDARGVAVFLGVAVACVGAGCVSSRPAAPATPTSVAPAKLVPFAGDFTDTDGNRFRDSTRVIVYVHADDPDRYPLPMKPEGVFQFRLENPAGKTIAAWNFDREKTAKAAKQLAPGPGFVFDLSLLDLGTDKLEDAEAELLITFTPIDGPVLRARPTAPLLIGPLSRRP